MPIKKTMIRIDPATQSIVTMKVSLPRKPIREFVRLMRAPGEIGERTLMQMSPAALMVAAPIDMPASTAKWRLRGGEDTMGTALLYGNLPPSKEKTGGIVDCPVNVDWLLARIVWTRAETEEDCAQRAADTIPLLNNDIRRVVASAQVMPTGEIWISADDHAQFGEAMVALDLVGDGVRRQRLNRLGQAVFDILTGDEA